ncbi:hypothetical protein [Microbispora sp. NPDC049125]|uniref:hypothetical protein n=1 Tax=Microbispora sp. NPDC049125 TaxID=3154929 RepID=UPI0034674CC2
MKSEIRRSPGYVDGAAGKAPLSGQLTNEEVMSGYAGLSTPVVKATTLIAYVASVGAVTWATINNQLGDQIYGRLIMAVLSFPVSIIDWFAGDRVFAALRGERHGVNTSGWDYAALGWPGLVTAFVLIGSMTLSRTQLLGRVVSWYFAAATLISGVVIAIDGWAPRRPWGWPLVACGVVMAVGLRLSKRRAP